MKTVYFFSGLNCVKCKTVKKFWNEIVENNTTYNFVIEDTDKKMDMAYKYKVMMLPTFLILDGETEVARTSGDITKKILQEFLDKNK